MVRAIQFEGYVSRTQHELLNQYVVKMNNCNKVITGKNVMNYLTTNSVPRTVEVFASEGDYLWGMIMSISDFQANNGMNCELIDPELISVGFNTIVPQGTTWNDLTDSKYSNRYLGTGAKLCDFATNMKATFNKILVSLNTSPLPRVGQTCNRLVDYTIVNITDPTADSYLPKTSAVSWSNVNTTNGPSILVWGHGVKVEYI
jgi:hypothetical protein